LPYTESLFLLVIIGLLLLLIGLILWLEKPIQPDSVAKESGV
jgi:hypothetical protein